MFILAALLHPHEYIYLAICVLHIPGLLPPKARHPEEVAERRLTPAVARSRAGAQQSRRAMATEEVG